MVILSCITLNKLKYMEELTLTTPALLFSAISLIMLAYTNRFLAYAAVIRNLHDKYLEKMDESLIEQIKNLKLRLNLTRYIVCSYHGPDLHRPTHYSHLDIWYSTGTSNSFSSFAY